MNVLISIYYILIFIFGIFTWKKCTLEIVEPSNNIHSNLENSYIETRSKLLSFEKKDEFKKILNPSRTKINIFQTIQQTISPEVKPKVYITEKGIKTLLISESSMLESAFSFGVGCGYYQDPDNIPGLAHLMEHVIFLGSQENPDPIGWDEFLLKKGGVSNAYTTGDSTVYYILSSPKELNSILTYFTKMLVNPVIDENSSVSEIDAVNQEHEKNIPNKVRLMIELLLYLSPEGCPARKFGTGNKETLYTIPKKENIDLKKALEEYHKSCYTYDNVSLIIMGPQSIEELIEISKNVDKIFGSNKANKGISKIIKNDKKRSNLKISNRNTFSPIQPSIFENIGNTKANMDITSKGGIIDFKKDEENNFSVELVKIPKGDSSPPLLIIYWDSTSDSMNIIRENAEWQMLKLIEYYFEDQGPNSMATKLQSKNLASSLEYFDNTSSQYSIFGLLFTPIDDSDENTIEIAKLLTSYMNNLIDQINNKDDKWIQNFYKNYANMANINYIYDEERNTAAIVSQAAENLLLFPDEPEMALSAFVKPYNLSDSEKLTESQIESLKSFVISLDPKKMKIIKLSDSQSNSENEKYFDSYKTKYSVSNIDIKENKENVKILAPKVSELLTCVPNDLNIISISNEKCPDYKNSGKQIKGKEIGFSYQPCPILIEEGLNVYWKGPIHKVPLINITFVQRLNNDDIKNDIRKNIIAKIHASLQNSRLDFELSNYKLCGLEVKFKYDRGRFILNVQGYSSNFKNVIESIKNSLVIESKLPSKSDFENALNYIKSDILNFSEIMAYDVASDVASSIYLSNYYSQLELKEYIIKENIQYNEYLDLIKNTFNKGYVDALVVGNITPDDAINYIKDITKSIITKSIPYSNVVHDGMLNLSNDVQVNVDNPISTDMNNAVVAHYITPITDFIDFSIYSSLAEMINSRFYDIIRTEWQDGYIAFATISYESPSMSLIGAVQSAEREIDTLKCHIFAALDKISKDIKDDLTNSSKSEFENKIRWLGLSQYSDHKLNTFSTYIDHFSKLIISHELCFEKNKLIENATQLFVSDPTAYIKKYNDLIEPSNNRKLILVELKGKENKENKRNDQNISNISDKSKPPSKEECNEILKNQLSNSIVKESKQKETEKKYNGNLRATRDSLYDEINKSYKLYDENLQCNISENNAKIATGRNSKELKDLIDIFRKKIFLENREKSLNLNDKAKDNNNNNNKRNKRILCNHNKY